MKLLSRSSLWRRNRDRVALRLDYGFCFGLALLLGCGEIHAQQDMEGSVPANWAASSGSLTISGNHSKIGTQSLRWDWSGGDSITVNSPGINAADVTNFYKNTCDLWIWNGTAIPGGKLRVEFMNGTTAQYWFDVYLDFTGWRRGVRSYTYDMAKKSSPSATFTSVRISAPATGSGRFYIDAVNWVGDRFTRFRDGQNPDITGYNADTSYADALASLPDIADTTPTAAELADLASVRARWVDAVKGGSAPSASSVTSAGSSFDAWNIVEGAEGIRGNPVGPATAMEGWTITLARDYAHGTATANASRDKMLLLARHIMDQGMASNSNDQFWGGVGDYSFRDLPRALVLMADAYDPATKAALWDFARWHYETGRYWNTNWERNTDDMHTGIFQQLGAILFLTPSDAEAVRMLKGFKRHVQRFLSTSDGGEDGIKPDGLGFHHRSHYNNYMYAFPTMSDSLYHLRDTVYQVDLATYQQLSSAFIAMMRLSADATGTTVGYFGNSLCGRKAFDTNLTFNRDHLRRLGEWGGRIAGQNADSVIARAYNRRFGVNDYSLFTPYGVEDAPDGFLQFNYSPVGIYRRADWVVSIRAPQKYFWSSEIFTSENRYGRYQSYGALEVLYNGGIAMSGQQRNGWDWNHTAGATTIVLPDNKLIAEKSREDVRSQLNFSGALSYQDGQSGIYGCNFQEFNEGVNHNPSFVWRKSWFCFNNQIICLGSDISNNDSSNPTATTLFQGKLASQSTAITLDGGAVTTFPYSNTASSASAHWMLDGFRNGYYVFPGTAVKITRSNQSSPDYTGSGPPTTANFAKAWLDHGNAPGGAGYEYVVFPATDASAMASAASLHGNSSTKPYEVVQRDSVAHVVKWKADGKTAYVIYGSEALPTATQNAGLLKSVERPCLMMMASGGAAATVSVVDPDLNFSLPTGGYGTVDASTPRTLDFTINGVWTLNAAPAGASVVGTSATTTTLRVTTHQGFAVYLDLLNAAAAQGVWANVGPDWNDPLNWGSTFGGGLPANNTSTDLAVLGAATVQPVLAGMYAVKGVTMDGGTNLSGHGDLTVGAGGIVAGGDSNVVSLAGVTLDTSQTWDVTSGDLVVTAAVTGDATQGLTKSGVGSLTLGGTNTYLGGTIVTPGSGLVTVSGDQRSASGSWLIGANSSAVTTVNFASGSQIATAVGRQIRIANTNASGNLNQTLNVAGEVSNDGQLIVGRPGILNLTSGGAWLQNDSMNLTAKGGYSSKMNVASNASFTYGGAATIKLNGSDGGNGQALLVVDGVFVTSTGFEQTTTPTGGFGRLTLQGGGTLKLGADVPVLGTAVQFELGSGGGVVDTNGFSATLSAGFSGSSLVKSGAGVLTLSGSNTYTGATTVEGGTLAVTGSLGNTPVEVENAASLVIGGNLSASVTVKSGGHLGFTIAATPGTHTGRTIGGTLALHSGNVIDLTVVTVPAPGAYVLATAQGISGAVGTVHLPEDVSGSVAIVDNSLRLTVSASPYSAWINGYQVGGMTAMGDDFDQDGLPNGIEFVLGGDPSEATPSGLLFSPSGGNSVSLVFPRNDAAKAMNLFCEVSEDLMTWPPANVYQIGADTASSTPGVVVSNNTDENPDTVTVTVPTTGKDRQFLRLKVSE